MSFIPGRGGNAQNKAEPVMPKPPARTPTAQPPTMADPKSMYPAVIALQELYDERSRLQAEVQALTNDLVVVRQRLQDKDRELDDERQRLASIDRLKDRYLRFAQEILTRGEDLGSRLDDLRARIDDVTRNQTIKTIDEMRTQLAKVLTRAMEAAQNAGPDPDQAVEQEIKKLISARNEGGEDDRSETMATGNA